MKLSNQWVVSILMALAPCFAWGYYPTVLIALLALLAITPRLIQLPAFLSLSGALLLSFAALAYYNFKVLPESAVAILGIMIFAKLHQKNQGLYSCALLGLLWVSLFALFNRQIFYIIYISWAYLCLLGVLKKEAKDKFSLSFLDKKRLVLLIKTVPFIIFLFIFFPRVKNIVPAITDREQNVVGYSTHINNSQSSNLAQNPTELFYAQINTEQIDTSKLYWRSLTYTQTDGYNWTAASEEGVSFEQNEAQATNEKSFDYEVFYLKNFAREFVTIEKTLSLSAMDGTTDFILKRPIQQTYQHKEKLSKITQRIRYQGVSQLKSSFALHSDMNNLKEYTQLPRFMPAKFQDFSSQITGESAQEIIKSFEKAIKEQGFAYRLDVTAMPTLNHFLEAKIGTCTHYASLLALTLRERGIPARLVSGLQGGQYNSEGDFYIVRSNDAHAWVEYAHDNRWQRIDPTLFIAPERIELGASNFLQTQRGRGNTGHFLNRLNLKLTALITTINYRILLFLDNFDREKQKELATQLGVKLQSFYLLGAILIFLALILLASRQVWAKNLITSFFNTGPDHTFSRFKKKMKKRGLDFPTHWPIEDIIGLLRKEEDAEVITSFLRTYQELKYSCPDEEQEKELLDKLLHAYKQL